MISSIIFIGSLLGISILIGVSLWEKKQEHKFYTAHRDRLDKITLDGVDRLIKKTPTFDAQLFRRGYHTSVQFGALAVLQIVKKIEKRAVKVLDTVRGKREFAKTESQSIFLKRVSEHKNGLEKVVEHPVE